MYIVIRMKNLNSYIKEVFSGKESLEWYPKEGDVGIVIPDRVKDDFDKYSGIDTECAVKFIKKVIDEFNWNGSATLFYSGYAGWCLKDEDEEKFGLIMYDKTKYGLDDATQGKGWYFKSSYNTHSNISQNDINKIKNIIINLAKSNDVPKKPRM